MSSIICPTCGARRPSFVAVCVCIGGGESIPPACPICGRVAASPTAVALCTRCRRRLAVLPRPQRIAALAIAHAIPAPRAVPIPPAPAAGQLSLF